MTRSKNIDYETAYGSNCLRLSARQWGVVFLIVAPLLLLASPIWQRVEVFEHPADYRVPYELSRDYWLYRRHLQHAAEDWRQPVFLVGDSVVWGEFVGRDGALSHFLTEQGKGEDTFVNAGLNGLFPLALEGLVEHYGGPLRRQKVLLHCNLLWMSSPEADLSSDKEQKFNHAALTPQFWPAIPCYRASVEDRTNVVVARWSRFYSWNSHVQICYHDSRSVPDWTMLDSGIQPPRSVNAYTPPWKPLTLRVPTEPTQDDQRGLDSARHQSWEQRGLGMQSLEWVEPSQSLQWAAFQRLALRLRDRDNHLMVVVGPFNRHLLRADSQAGWTQWRETVRQWLDREAIACIFPEPLASDLYADASHPVTRGYQELSRQLLEQADFQGWLSDEAGKPREAGKRPPSASGEAILPEEQVLPSLD